MKNDFVERKSLLDQLDDDTAISRSPFRGILRMALLMGLIYALNSGLKSNHLWEDLDFIGKYKHEILITFKFWASFVAYTHLSLIV